MSKANQIDETTELLRRTVIDVRSRKHCIRDFSGEVFELTSDMLIDDRNFNKDESGELSGIAERILQKYAKLLSLSK